MPKLPNNRFDNPLQNKILTMDLLSPYGKKDITVKLGIFPNFNGYFGTSPFFDGFVSPSRPKLPCDGFDKPLQTNVLTTDFVSPSPKKFFMVGMAYFNNKKLKSIEKKGKCRHLFLSKFV